MFITLFLLSALFIAGCSGIATKECLYRNGVNDVNAMGVLCNDDGLDDCIKIRDNLDEFKSIETENLICSSTKLKKIVNSNGAFVNCNSADDCYRVLNIEKPFDDFNAIVCDKEYCKTTTNYDKKLTTMLKSEETSNEIPLEPVTENTTTQTSTNTNPIIVPTGCGDNICDMEETCSNCEEDCGCSYNTYCNTTKSPAMCMKLPEE